MQRLHDVWFFSAQQVPLSGLFDLSQLSCQVTACSCERFQRIMSRRVCFFGFRQVIVQFKSFALLDF